MMESARPAPAFNLATLGKTFARLARLRHSAAAHGGGGVGVAPEDENGIPKLKLRNSGKLDGYSSIQSEHHVQDNDLADKKLRQKNREAMDSVLANLFAGVSAVKASYAQLQVAQSPYDPDTIQYADNAVVSELKHLSELKHSYLTNQLPAPSPLVSEAQEQRNLLKTYKITTKKLESDLQTREANLDSLRSQLLDSENQNHVMKAQLRPIQSDDLHLSGLNPTHFLAALRQTVKTVRSFVKLMVKEMETAGWDIAAAAASIHPGLLLHSAFAYESFVCQMMFSDFQHKDFSLGSLEEMARWDRRRFFDEFTAAKGVTPRQLLERPAAEQSLLGKFIRVKYLLLVHPKMEAAFFGDLDQRELVNSGKGFPGSGFFAGFAEMAWRVWLLHCLFFSFGAGEEGSIFQARRGSRFSEVYMESVVVADTAAKRPTVGFTVVPGFRVGKTVIQCKVYPSTSGTGRGRS